MACSPDCFKEYMIRIEESRKPIVEEEITTAVSETKVIEKTSKTTSKTTKKKTANEAIKTDDIIED